MVLPQTQCAARGSAPCRGKPGAWKAARLATRPNQLVRVGKSAQEQFLEYAHYLPERSVQAAVDRQRVAGFAVLESTELAQDMDANQVRASCAGRMCTWDAHGTLLPPVARRFSLSLSSLLSSLQGSHPLRSVHTYTSTPNAFRNYMQVFMLLEEMSMEFEEAVKLGGGWTELALPSEEEAHRYFASFRRAPPDNSALAPSTQVGQRLLLHNLPVLGIDCHSRACLKSPIKKVDKSFRGMYTPLTSSRKGARTGGTGRLPSRVDACLQAYCLWHADCHHR